MKKNMFILALATAAGSAFAQNSIVSDIAGTFVDISANPGAVNLVTGNADDVSYVFTSTVGNSMFLPGFVRPCTNGYVIFGAATGSATFTNAAIADGTVSPVAPTTAQALFPHWDDQYVYVANGAAISWIEGPAADFGLPAAAGNVLIIQWSNIDHYLTSPQKATYQVQIFQNPLGGTVAAQMLYSSTIFGDANDDGASATVGYASGTTGGANSINNVQWSFNTAGGITSGMVLSVLTPSGPFSPSGTGLANPTPALAGNPVLYTVTVSPGGNPVSTALAVTADLSQLGGAAAQAFVDNGTNGDALAGDNIFSYTYTTAANFAGGTFDLPYTISDGESRTASGNISSTIDPRPTWDEASDGGGDSGADLATAQVPFGTGTAINTISGNIEAAGDVDLYRISICDQANFSVTTAEGTAGDTQLFLFNTDGTGVVMNDDVPDGFPGDATLLSRLSGALVPATGEYYLAISRYDNDPLSVNGVTIWFDTAFNLERGPDGDEPTGVLGSWTGGGLAGTYRLTFTGACFSGPSGPCSEADIGIAGGLPGQDNLLDNNDFIAFITYFFDQDPVADMGIAGGLPGSDSQWDNNDFIAFINHFFNDGANCNG